MPYSIGASRLRPWAALAALGLALTLLLPGSAIAQSSYSDSDETYGPVYPSWTGAESHQKSKDEAWKTSAFTGLEFQGETDLDRRGDFKYWMISGGVSTGRMVGDNVKVALKGDYRAVGYDFGIPNAVVASDPWETVHVLRLNPVLTYLINDTWSILGGPIVEFSGEENANFGDSLNGGGLVGFGYTRDKLYLAFGVLAVSQIEKDARIQPFVIVNWNITNGLALGLKGDTSRGGEFRLDYSFTDNFTLGFGIGIRRELFRLNGDGGPGAGPGTSRQDGVGEEFATVAKITAVYQINKMIAIEGYGGVTFNGEFRLEDEDGLEIAESDYDDSGFGGVNLRFSF
jgi:hypothetical protein